MSPSQASSLTVGTRPSPRWLSETILLGAVLVVAVAIFQSLDGVYALDCDDLTLALSISRFDIISFQPHPPGYLGYVLLLKAVHTLTRQDPILVTRIVSHVFALLAIVWTWRAALRLVPHDRNAALFAAALVGLHPILLYYGVDAQTHSAEMAMSALLLWTLAMARTFRGLRMVVAIGLVLAAGGSLRPSYALVSVGPVLWTFRRDWRALFVIGLVGAAGTLAWFIPTVALTPGGLATYRAASDSLMGNLIRMVSPLSTSAIPRLAHGNLIDGLCWTGLALAPAIFALLVRARGWRSTLTSWPVTILACMAIPTGLFSCLVMCAEAGYLAGLVPPAALVAATLLSQGNGARPWQAHGRAVLVAAELAFFLFSPSGQGVFTMMPTTSEIAAREARTDALHAHLRQGLRSEDSILVLSDWPEPTALRQLPLLRSHSEILQVPWQLRSDFQPVYSMSLATDHDWTGLFPVPGQPLEYLRHRSVARNYDWILVDPRTSDRVRDELRAHSRCEIPRFDDERQVRLRPECFPDRRVQIGDFTFRFGTRDGSAKP
jgi:hypothetical protein